MEIGMALLLRNKPEVRGASWNDNPGIELILPKTINFARATHGEAHMLIGGIYECSNDENPHKEEEGAKNMVEKLVKALKINDEEIDVKIEKVYDDPICLKVTITAK